MNKINEKELLEIIPETTITIIQLKDGSWKGWATRFGTKVSVREAKPEDCLTKLMTNDGTEPA